MSPEAQLSYQKPNVFLPYALLWHGVPSLCTFSVICLMWELCFKSLTNMFVCWTAEMTQLSLDVLHPFQFSSLGDDGLTGQGWLGSMVLTPTPCKHLTWNPLAYLQLSSCLLYRKCFLKKQYLVTILLHLHTAECLLYVPAVLHQGALVPF